MKRWGSQTELTYSADEKDDTKKSKEVTLVTAEVSL